MIYCSPPPGVIGISCLHPCFHVNFQKNSNIVPVEDETGPVVFGELAACFEVK